MDPAAPATDAAPPADAGGGWLRAAFDDAPVGMALVGLDGRLVRANRALGALVGHLPAALVGTPLAALVHPEDAGASAAPLWALTTGELPACQAEVRLAGPGGAIRWVALSASLLCDAAGRPACYALHLPDVTERRDREERLRHRANHDALTGLPNRALFAARLERALAGARERGDGTGVAVLLLDLDGFKAVNDGLGHEAGDRLLVAVGQRLAACLRAGDVAARFGGDEFALLVERVQGAADAEAVARRVLSALRAPVPLGGHEAAVAASVGIACGSGGEARAEDLLRAADAALYRAKAAGGATHAAGPPPGPRGRPLPGGGWLAEVPLAGD
jgi:diguanylate cyclase (GGDEF)-like protein/PAS domain S-box-containing protein